jgi:GNAT superfamily N-acetyltransferase
MSARIRRAGPADAEAVARLYRRTADAAWPFLAPHTPEEDLAFFTRAIARGAVWLAEADGGLVGICAARRGWIDHFYVAPERQGRGIGRALLARALKGRRRVRLWTFLRNARSRAIYRRQGFCEVRFTDGAGNEEKEPDVMLEWIRPARRPGARPPGGPQPDGAGG